MLYLLSVCFYRNRIYLAEQFLDQRKCTQLKFTASFYISVHEFCHDIVSLSRCNIGKYGDNTFSAK